MTPKPKPKLKPIPTPMPTPFDLGEGTPVIVYLHEPKEKVWGVLLSIGPAGVILRGLDLLAFEDWMRQEARQDEVAIGLSTLFYPMHRVERLEKDETIGPLLSYADRYTREVGRTIRQAIGLDSED